MLALCPLAATPRGEGAELGLCRSAPWGGSAPLYRLCQRAGQLLRASACLWGMLRSVLGCKLQSGSTRFPTPRGGDVGSRAAGGCTNTCPAVRGWLWVCSQLLFGGRSLRFAQGSEERFGRGHWGQVRLGGRGAAAVTREGSAPVSEVTRAEACGKVMLPQGQGYRRGEQQGGRPCKPCLEPFPRLHCTEAAPGVPPCPPVGQRWLRGAACGGCQAADKPPGARPAGRVALAGLGCGLSPAVRRCLLAQQNQRKVLVLSFPLQHFPPRPVFHLDDRSQPALEKPLLSKPPARAITIACGGVAASCGTGAISYTRCPVQPRGFAARSAPCVGAAGAGVRGSCPGLGSLVWASAAHQLGAGSGQVWGAACCQPSGVPGAAGEVVSLKLLVAVTGVEQLCSGDPGSAVLVSGHLARGAQKWGCKAR